MKLIPKNDEFFMRKAIALAKKAEAKGEVPIGALVTLNNQIIGEGYNRPISSSNPTAHAEVEALRATAFHVGNYRLVDTTLYVTLEPCIMCVGAMIHARISRLVFGAYDKKNGAIVSAFHLLDDRHNHSVDYQGGILSSECAQLLSDFFQKRRHQQKGYI